MTPEAALLSVAIAAYFAPEALALLWGTRAAWEFVFSGVEAWALWVYVGAASTSLVVRCIATWGAFEAFQRPICRLAFPMDRKPSLPEGANLCDVALGIPMSWVSVFAALFVAALAQEYARR